MKIPAAFVALLFTASLVSAQTQPAAKPMDTAATAVAPTDAKVAPADTPAAPAPSAPIKKVVKTPPPEPKSPGMTLNRANGTFLGLEVANGFFKLSFYDKKKKPMAPDVTRVAMRWPNQRARGDIHAVMNPSGNSLVSTQRAETPVNYKIFLTLLAGEGADATAVESFPGISFHE